MKIGMILECSLSGPDVAVYKYVANKLCPTLEIAKPITKGDKKTLIAEAALEAKTLLDTGCNKVFIIWDRMPRWKEDVKGNCETDQAALAKSLEQLGVNLKHIYLCCIDEMMESWLIADSRGFMTWIRSKTDHKLKDIGDRKAKDEQTSPKQRIENYLRDNYGKWKYCDYNDNLPIVKNLPDFERVSSYNSSFRYFKESIERICVA